MTKEKKAALFLAGTLLLGALPVTLSGCITKKKDNEDLELSETSIDTKDIVVIDTYNNNVLSKGVNKRYLILYRVGLEENTNINMPNSEVTSYIYSDIMNKDYVGVFTEIKSDKETLTLFAYSKKDMTDTNCSIIVKPSKDISWYGHLDKLLDKDNQKSSYTLSELIELYNVLNEGYMEKDNQTTSGYEEELKYTLEKM